MTDQWDYSELLQPLSEESPCGENLEDSQLLYSFDTFRLFGQSVPLNPPPDWRAIENKSLDALAQSKDLRLLAHLGAAVLRTKGLGAFVGTLSVAAQWLEQWWDQVYPLVEEDAILRRTALNSFADRMAVVDGVRRAHFVRHPQLGAFNLRHVEIAAGKLTPSEADGEPPDESQIKAALAASPIDEITQQLESVRTALDALKRIDGAMREHAGSEGAPTFDPLVSSFLQLQQILDEAISIHPDSAASSAESEGAAPNESTAAAPAAKGFAVGSIASRQDAIKALDAVAMFFRQTEPSSPVPLFVERAKRLIGKDLLEVLEDIAPDAVATVKQAGGIRDEESSSDY
jgi:type VI secretion system protein ImpA